MFADDISFFSVVHDIDTPANYLNHDLEKNIEWAFRWKMKFNPDPTKQTQEIIFRKIKAQVDKQSQYSRRNCLFFHEIKEEKGEDTDSITITTVKEEMDIEILPNYLGQLHHIGNPKTKKK